MKEIKVKELQKGDFFKNKIDPDKVFMYLGLTFLDCGTGTRPVNAVCLNSGIFSYFQCYEKIKLVDKIYERV